MFHYMYVLSTKNLSNSAQILSLTTHFLFIHSIIWNWGTSDFASAADTFEWSQRVYYSNRVVPRLCCVESLGLKDRSSTFFRNFATF